MVSLTVSHVKVEVDLTLPLPPVVEFERESGEVVEVQVHYPWVPPTCSHCHELGHILRNCLTYTPPVSEKEKEKGKEKASTSKHNETPKPYKTTKNTNPPPSDFTPSKASRNNQKRYQAVSKTPSEKTQITGPVPQEPPEIVPSLPSSSLFQQSPSPPPDPSNSHAASNIFSSPDPTPRPSLKRSRSSPILSPPESASANPFSELQTLTFSGLPPLTLTFPTPFPPLFGALLETHIKEPSLSPILAKMCPRWKFLSNHLSDPDGRIVLIWKDPLIVQPLSQSRQHLTCVITIPNLPPLYYTAVYASNLSEERADLWNELLQNQSTYDLESRNWVVGGDLNQILFPVEHSHPAVDFTDNLMYQAQDCFLQAGLFDLRYLGPCHTWTNNQPDSPIA
ncbi:unnamed protein product, partial [Brassica rapa subsp. trilocularis]